MRQFVCLFLALACSLNAETDSGGLFRFQTVKFFDRHAVSLLADLGEGNWRGNLTYATEWQRSTRFKVTGEYLFQKHAFAFTPGIVKRNIGQAAFGATLEQLVDSRFFKLFYINANASFAQSKTLSSLDYRGSTYSRVIQGADFYQGRVGTSINTPCCGYLNVFAGYQGLSYHKKGWENQNSDGYDVGALLHQPLYKEFALNLEAESNPGYNFYRSSLDWMKNNWKVGAFTSYVDGKRGLNNDFRWGFELAVALGAPCHEPCGGCRTNETFQDWVARPAVLRPVTLAIAAQSSFVTPVCPLPVVLNSTPPDWNVVCFVPNSYDASVLFSGDNITYSASNLGGDYAIDPVTGVISGNSIPVVGTGSTITVTATNACGSVSVDIDVNIPDC